MWFSPAFLKSIQQKNALPPKKAVQSSVLFTSNSLEIQVTIDSIHRVVFFCEKGVLRYESVDQGCGKTSF